MKKRKLTIKYIFKKNQLAALAALMAATVGFFTTFYITRLMVPCFLLIALSILTCDIALLKISYRCLLAIKVVLFIRYLFYGGSSVFYIVLYVLLIVSLTIMELIFLRAESDIKVRIEYHIIYIIGYSILRFVLYVWQYFNRGITKLGLLISGANDFLLICTLLLTVLWLINTEKCRIENVHHRKNMKLQIAKILVCVAIIPVFIFITFISRYKPSYYENIIPRMQSTGVELNSEICDLYENKKGIVTIISDDGYYSSGVMLYELANKYKLNITVAGVSEIIDKHLREWREIVSSGNIEIVSHSYSHMKMSNHSEIAQDIDGLEHEIFDSISYLEENFKIRQVAFVCPENVMSDTGYAVLKKTNISAVRRGTRGLNQISPQEGEEPFNWFNLGVQGICDEGVDTKVRNSWVTMAADKRLWLIEMWHNVAQTDDGYYQTISKKDAEEHLKFISENKDDLGVWVATFSEATKYIKERQSAVAKALLYEDRIEIVANIFDNKIPTKLFNQELTIKIALLDKLWLDKAMLNSNSKFWLQEENGRQYLYINVRPNEVVTVLYK